MLRVQTSNSLRVTILIFCFLLLSSFLQRLAADPGPTYPCEYKMELLNYKLVGTGSEKVLVMHNWFCDSSCYKAMIPYMDTDNFTYLFVDLRGYGGSKELLGDYSVQEAANDVIELINVLKWHQFHVVGHSMSGMIAQKIALDHFSRVKSVVAITPVPASGTQAPSEVMNFLEEAAGINDEYATECIHLATGRRYSDAFTNEMVKQWRLCSTPASRHGYLQMYSNTDFSESIKGLTTPMLVLLGEHDFKEYENLYKNTFLMWYPNAKMECCYSTGHFPMLETPIYLISRIEKFLKIN